MTNQEYKTRSHEALRFNWSPAVLATVILMLVVIIYVGASETPTFMGLSQNVQLALSGGSLIFAFLIYYPLEVGYYNAMRVFVIDGDKDATVNMWKFTTNNYLHIVWGYVVMEIKLLLWTMLFIIPGIIKSFAYAMTPFILVEFPELTANEASKLSDELMKGHKFDLFYLLLSFIGWFLLCLFTAGIGFLWLEPYVTGALAVFYEDVKSQYPGDLAPATKVPEFPQEV